MASSSEQSILKLLETHTLWGKLPVSGRQLLNMQHDSEMNAVPATLILPRGEKLKIHAAPNCVNAYTLLCCVVSVSENQSIHLSL